MAGEYESGLDGMVFNEFAELVEDEPVLGVEDIAIDLPLDEPPAEEGPTEEPEIPAAERLEALFGHMLPYKKQLLAIIEFCSQPKESAEVLSFVTDLQRYSAKAFAPESLVTLLVNAGGLAKLDETGEPFDPSKTKPKEVVVDGVTYYEVSSETPQVFLSSTEDALALLGQDDRVEKTNVLLEERSDFLFVIQAILRMASRSEGVQIKEIDDAILSDPRFKGSKWRPNSFLNKLEEADAVAYCGSWRTTAYGLELLESIGSNMVTDDEVKSALNV